MSDRVWLLSSAGRVLHSRATWVKSWASALCPTDGAKGRLFIFFEELTRVLLSVKHIHVHVPDYLLESYAICTTPIAD